MRTFLLLCTFIFFIGPLNNIWAQNQHHILVINCFIDQNELEKAKQYALSNKLDEMQDPVLLASLAYLNYANNNYKESANLYLKSGSLSKELFFYELAQCYAQMRQNNYAIDYLKKHLEQKNKYSESEIKSDNAFLNLHRTSQWKELWQTNWYSKSELLIANARYEFQNKRYYNALENLDQVKGTIWEDKAYYLKSAIYAEMKEPANAMIAIDKAVELNSDVANYHFIKSCLELDAKNNKKALLQINSALKLDSTHIEFYVQKAKTLFALKQTSEAIELISELVNLKPDAEMYKLASNIMIQANEPFEAIKNINKAIILQPYNPELYIQRADIYMQTNTFDFAEKDYGMAMDFYSPKGELYFKRGIARLNQNKLDDACSDFTKARRFGYVNADTYIQQHCNK